MTAAQLAIEIGMPSTPSSHRIARWRGSFDDGVVRVRQAVADEQLVVLHEIDTQLILATGGYAIPPLRQLLFFHPRYMIRLLAVDPAAVIEVPLKAVISTTRTHGVEVRIPDPRPRLGGYPGLEELGAELAAACARILARLGDAAVP